MKPLVGCALIAAALQPSLRAQPLPPLLLSDWSHVRTISAGHPIRAAYIGRQQGHQYFLSATDDTMTILMPDRLPRSVRNALIDAAGRAPKIFTPTTWNEFAAGRVRITPGGIFDGPHRIAALEDVVLTVDRGDVADVSQEVTLRRQRQRPGYGPDSDTGVAAASGVAGLLATFAACKDRCSDWALLAGFIGPPIAVTFLLSRHEERAFELVYRAY